MGNEQDAHEIMVGYYNQCQANIMGGALGGMTNDDIAAQFNYPDQTNGNRFFNKSIAESIAESTPVSEFGNKGASKRFNGFGFKKKEKNMLTEVAGDIRSFIKEHKSTIYWIAMLLIIDHFFFHGAFKDKLKSMMNNLVGKVESKVNDVKLL